MFITQDLQYHNDGAAVLNGRAKFGNGEHLDDMIDGPVPFELGFLRPFVETNPNSPARGQRCVQVSLGQATYNNETGIYEPRNMVIPIRKLQERGINSPTWNATSLRKETWTMLLQGVTTVFREPLTVYDDIRAAGTVPGVDPYRMMTIEYEVMSDPGEVVEDMDVISDARTDSPLFKVRSYPVSIIYGDFNFSERRLGISQANGGSGLRTVMNEAISRRAAERVEDKALGNVTGITFGTRSGDYATAHDGTSTQYGLRDHPARIQKTNFTAPTTGGWVPNTLYTEVLTALATMRTNKSYGPYYIYFSTDYWPYMSQVFSLSGGNNNNETLMSMLLKIPGVTSVRPAERLTSTFTLLIVENRKNTVQAVDAMAPTMVQWPSLGGARQNFRVMCSQGVLFQYDYNGVLHVLHGTTS